MTSPPPTALQITQTPQAVSPVQRQSPTQSDLVSAQRPINPNTNNDEVSQVISLINDNLLSVTLTGTKRKIIIPKKLRRPGYPESENEEIREEKRLAYRKEVEERRARAVIPPEQAAQNTRLKTPAKETKGPLNLIRRTPRTPKLPNAENNDPPKKDIPALMSLIIPVPEKFRKQQLLEGK